MINQSAHSQKSDEELVALSLGNQDYFACLINRYEAKLWRYISRLSKLSREEIEDILQDIFIKVYQNLNSFNPNLKFSSWIYRIAYNEVISAFRKSKIRVKAADWDVDNEIINSIAADFDIKKELDNEYLRKQIKKILNSLDFKYSQVLVLKYLEAKSYKEMSDILQRPEGTIAALINRAKKHFMAEFNRQNIKL